MNRLSALAGRLSYANVIATLALFIALGGGAYALNLPKSSVGSKQIKDNGVKSKDVKDADLTGVDLADGAIAGAELAPNAVGSGQIADGAVGASEVGANALGGGQIDEGSLAQVPDAGLLDGIDSSALRRDGGHSFSTTFVEGAALQEAVPGYGTFFLQCNDNNTVGTPTDDLVNFAYSQVMGASARVQALTHAASTPTGDPTVRLIGPDAETGFSTFAGSDRVRVEMTLLSGDGTKAIQVSAHGFEDETSTTNCTGWIETTILR